MLGMASGTCAGASWARRSLVHRQTGAGMRAMVEMSGTGRLGTPADIAEAAALLLASATFVTGTDLLVDGGVVAAVRAQAWAG